MGLYRKLLTLIGDTQYFGWKHPFWFSVAPPGYKLKGEHYRLIRPLLQPGDILLQRFEGWIDKWFIPGFWNHAAIYLGNDAEQVVHAVSDGVLIEDVINFMRTDHLIILRPHDRSRVEDAIKRAQSIVGAEYDFGFSFSDHTQFSCTEVVSYCYPHLFPLRTRWGREVIVPDDLADSLNVEIIWDSRKHQTDWLPVGVKAFGVSAAKSKVKMRTITMIVG